MQYRMGDEEHGLVEREAVWEYEQRAECEGTLASQSEDHAENWEKEGNRVGAEE